MSKLFYLGPSLDVLHGDYARHGRVDELAPVRVSEQTLVTAPPARVWALLSDPSKWHAVDHTIKAVHLDTPLDVDTTFTWTNGKARIRSRVAVIKPERELTWTGTSAGSRAIHRYLLEPTGDGGTLLRSEESISGLLLPLFFSSSKASTALAKWLAALKAAAEQ
jgi:hypothetical protein